MTDGRSIKCCSRTAFRRAALPRPKRKAHPRASSSTPTGLPVLFQRLSQVIRQFAEHLPDVDPNSHCSRQKYGRRVEFLSRCRGFQPGRPAEPHSFEQLEALNHTPSKSFFHAASMGHETFLLWLRLTASEPWRWMKTGWPRAPILCSSDIARSGTGKSVRTRRQFRTGLRRKDKSPDVCSSVRSLRIV